MRCEGYMLMTKDIEASKVFYTEVLGATIFVDLGGHVVFEEGFSLLIEQDWRKFAELDGEPLRYKHNTGQLVFEVDALEPFLHRLEETQNMSFTVLHPAKEHPWGRWAIRLYDPDGHIVEVGESMKVVVKRFLQQGMSVEETASRSEFPESYVRQCLCEMEGGPE